MRQTGAGAPVCGESACGTGEFLGMLMMKKKEMVLLTKKVWGQVLVGVLLLVGLLVLVYNQGRANANQFGVVDPGVVVSNSPKVFALYKQIDAKTQELNARMEKDKASLKPEQLAAKQNEYTQEFQVFRSNVEGQINGLTQQAMDDVARDKGFNNIFVRSGVARGGVDVTADVIKKLAN